MFSLLSLSEFIPALLAGLIASLCSIGLMGTAAWLITKASLQPPLYALTLGITGVRACGIGRAVFRYADRYLSHRMAFHFYSKLQAKLYRQAEARLPMQAGPARQGEFLELLTKGSETLRDFWLRTVLPPFITLLLTLLAVYALSFDLGAIALLLLILWSLHLLLPYALQRLPGKKNVAADYRSSLLDLQAGAEELLCAKSISTALQHLHRSTLKMQRASITANKRQDTIDFMLTICDNACLLLLFALLIARSLTIVELGVWLLLLLALISEFRPLSSAARNYHEAQPAKAALLTTTKVTVSNLSATNDMPANKLLTVQHLRFSYLPEQPIFTDLSFSIKPGQHTAIVGESGAGKTTLGYLLTGLWQPDAGTIQKNGELVAALQGSYLFSASIRENFLHLYPQIDEAAIRQALAIAQLSDVVKQMPQGIDTSLGTDGCYLSGGQRTRLLTALTLPSNAPLILLDEPTAGLDAQTAKHIITALLHHIQHSQQTLIIITHDKKFMAKMQQTIIIDSKGGINND